MSYYRLYFMCPKTGHILRFEEFDAPDDKAAMARGSGQEGYQPLEIWCRHRKVGRIEAVDVKTRMLERRRQQKQPKASSRRIIRAS